MKHLIILSALFFLVSCGSKKNTEVMIGDIWKFVDHYDSNTFLDYEILDTCGLFVKYTEVNSGGQWKGWPVGQVHIKEASFFTESFTKIWSKKNVPSITPGAHVPCDTVTLYIKGPTVKSYRGLKYATWDGIWIDSGKYFRISGDIDTTKKQ